MHPDVHQEKSGQCPQCGMTLIKTDTHQMNPLSEMSFWEKFSMGMTMTMGMDHTGKTGREMAKLMEEDIRNKFFFSLVVTLPILAYSMGEMLLGWQLPSPLPKPWLLFLLTTPVFFIGGWLFLYSSYYELKTRKLGMSVLIAVGITAAYGFSVLLTIIGSNESFYEAAAMLITFVLFGHWMEMKARRGTTDALQALFDLVPQQSRLLKHGKEILVATAEIKMGDILVLKPGDKVPVDGIIISGETSLDESLITGESIPVTKQKGDTVIGGSINQSGSVNFKATKIGEETTLGQIAKMVETAQNSKAPGQRLADRFASYLVILAVGSGVVTFVVWFFLLGQPFLVALTFAISAIVIACPDALGLATPTAVAVGTGLGAKHNILIKDAMTLEQASQITAVVMDKTGTMTEGKPIITDVITLPQAKMNSNEMLRLLAAAESKSSHPLSHAVLNNLKEKHLSLPTKIDSFKNLSGQGVEARVNDQQILVGTLKLMHERKIDYSSLQKDINQLLDSGKTLMLIAVEKKILGVIGAMDPIKPTAKHTIAQLKKLGVEVAMITGDNQKTAETIGKEIGITRIFADVLPAEKASYVKKLQHEGKVVAMVGDGVNDAPALAQADIGIAIGAGTDVAIETAKIVLMKSDPADILRAIRLSKATVRKMKQNLFWASIYNLSAIPLAAGVLYPTFHIALRPEIAALLMSISSIIVATNAVLLNRTEKDLVTV